MVKLSCSECSVLKYMVASITIVGLSMVPITSGQVENVLTIKINETYLEKILVDETRNVPFFLWYPDANVQDQILVFEESPDGITHVRLNVTQSYPLNIKEQMLHITGIFLGFSKIKINLSSANSGADVMESELLPVSVRRESTLWDHIFVAIIIILTLIAFINMGCTINLDVVKENLRRPIAPAIGLFSQYLFMPLLSYGLGYLLFYNRPELWMGLFLTGCSPGGGASNIWTYLLGGSLDLSVTMTFLSTVLAFAALPLWVLALGPTIAEEADFGKLPYGNIAMFVLTLVVPISIGLLIRKFSPRAADVLKKMIKPVSILFIVYVMTFGIYVNFYIFSFLIWQVALVGFLVPFLGFIFGLLIAKACRRNIEDVIAISIETGIQNTGLSIVMLKVALKAFDPLGEIAMVVPIAVATMTPIPLLFVLLRQKIRTKRRESLDLNSPEEMFEFANGQKARERRK